MPTKVQVTIEIPDGYELAEIEMRCPKFGEYYLSNRRREYQPILSSMDFYMELYPILRKKWEWPKWLIACCIAMNSDTNWYAYERIPTYNEQQWRNGGKLCGLNPLIQDVVLPICTDWTKSLIKNPNIGEPCNK